MAERSGAKLSGSTDLSSGSAKRSYGSDERSDGSAESSNGSAERINNSAEGSDGSVELERRRSKLDYHTNASMRSSERGATAVPNAERRATAELAVVLMP